MTPTSWATRSFCEWLKHTLATLLTPVTLLILILLTLAPLTLQELKDDLLDDTTLLVVMQWFNEDH